MDHLFVPNVVYVRLESFSNIDRFGDITINDVSFNLPCLLLDFDTFVSTAICNSLYC